MQNNRLQEQTGSLQLGQMLSVPEQRCSQSGTYGERLSLLLEFELLQSERQRCRGCDGR